MCLPVRVGNICRFRLRCDRVEDRRPSYCIVHDFAAVFHGLRYVDLRDDDVQIVGVQLERLVAILECLGRIARQVLLRQLPVRVCGCGFIAVVLLGEVLVHRDALLRIGLGRDGREFLVLGRSGGNDDLHILRPHREGGENESELNHATGESHNTSSELQWRTRKESPEAPVSIRPES